MHWPIVCISNHIMQGPEIGGVLELLANEDGDVVDRTDYVSLDERIAALNSWLTQQA